MSWVESGRVVALGSGTPCSSFSTARRAPSWSRMPHRIRSNEHPTGLPGLSQSDGAIVANGNLLSRRASAILKAACVRGIPCYEENPKSSYLWSCHGRAARAGEPYARTALLDQCGFGGLSKKLSRIDAFHCNASRLAIVCCGKEGTCSFTGKKHMRLSCIKGKIFLTQAAACYPTRLANELANMLHNAIVQLQVSRTTVGFLPWVPG